MLTMRAPNTEDALKYAVDAIEQGKLKYGREALGWVLQREPDNQVAWLWMACTLSDETEKRECYTKISS